MRTSELYCQREWPLRRGVHDFRYTTVLGNACSSPDVRKPSLPMRFVHIDGDRSVEPCYRPAPIQPECSALLSLPQVTAECVHGSIHSQAESDPTEPSHRGRVIGTKK